MALLGSETLLHYIFYLSIKKKKKGLPLLYSLSL
jgi:hypothetical protein